MTKDNYIDTELNLEVDKDGAIVLASLEDFARHMQVICKDARLKCTSKELVNDLDNILDIYKNMDQNIKSILVMRDQSAVLHNKLYPL